MSKKVFSFGNRLALYDDLSNYPTTQQVQNLINEHIVQYSVIPTASSTNEGDIIQYTGTTTSSYINGYYYKCISDGASTPTYSWQCINVQPETEMIKIPATLWSLELGMTNAQILECLGGQDNVNKILSALREDKPIFCVSHIESPIGPGYDYVQVPISINWVDMSGDGYFMYINATVFGEFWDIELGCNSNVHPYTWSVINIERTPSTIQCSTMPIATENNVGRIVQYIGSTTSNYTNGYFYKCIGTGSNPIVYNWEKIDVGNYDYVLPLIWADFSSLQDATIYDTNTIAVLNQIATNWWDITNHRVKPLRIGAYFEEGETYDWTFIDLHVNGFIYGDNPTDTQLKEACLIGGTINWEHKGSGLSYYTVRFAIGYDTSNQVWKIWFSGTNYISNSTFFNSVYCYAVQNHPYAIINKSYLESRLSQCETVPTANLANLNKIIQYTGTTNTNYTNGYYYKCISNGASTPTYSWQRIDVQPETDINSILYNIVAPPYDENNTYANGDYVLYNNQLYICVQYTDGQFNPDSWHQVKTGAMTEAIQVPFDIFNITSSSTSSQIMSYLGGQDNVDKLFAACNAYRPIFCVGWNSNTYEYCCIPISVRIADESSGNFTFYFRANVNEEIWNLVLAYDMYDDPTWAVSNITITPLIVQYSTMPIASVNTVGKIVQYTGTTDSTYTHGYFYEGRAVNILDSETLQTITTYTWVRADVQPSNYLAKDNTSLYMPTGNYNPATKKYVDDSIGAISTGIHSFYGTTDPTTVTGSVDGDIYIVIES